MKDEKITMLARLPSEDGCSLFYYFVIFLSGSSFFVFLSFQEMGDTCKIYPPDFQESFLAISRARLPAII